LFVFTDLSRKLEVLQTAGVRWFVEHSGHACRVPDAEIEVLQKVCASGVRVEPHPFLKQGDPVRLSEGPLAGIEGILTQVKNEHRIVLSVELLKRSVAVEVDLLSVERIGEPKVRLSGQAASERRNA
jgi:transcription antitermination factor NusG